MWDACELIGWAAPHFNVFKLRDGTLIYFGTGRGAEGTLEVDPALIKKLLKDEYEQAALVGSQLHQELADVRGVRGYSRHVVEARHAAVSDSELEAGVSMNTRVVEAAKLWRRGKFKAVGGNILPWIWPIRAVARAAKRIGWAKGAASLRALAEGGWPIQFKLWVEGRARHNLCKCQAAVGTLWHKIGECELSQELRSAECPAALLRAGRVAAWDPLFSRAVPARPKDVSIPTERTWIEKADASVEAIVTGEVYSDGSARGRFWRSSRAGWAFVVFDPQGGWKWTAKGTVGGLDPSSFRAELKALLEALRLAVPPVTIYVDNSSVVRGVEKGEEWCTSSGATGAGLWREIWAILRDLEGQEVHVRKIKAHTGWWDVLLGRITHRQHVGNGMADTAAKEAQCASEAMSPTKSFNEYLNRAVLWLKWVMKYTVKFVDDIDPDKEEEARTRRKLNREVLTANEPGRNDLQHEAWIRGGTLQCRRCGISWSAGSTVEARHSLACNGCAAGRAAEELSGNPNYRWGAFAKTTAAMVEKGARLISKPFPPQWMVEESTIDEVADSREHFRELRRSAGLGGGDRPWSGAAGSQRFKERQVDAHGTRAREAAADSREEGGGVGGSRWGGLPWLRAPEWMPDHFVQAHERAEGGVLNVAEHQRSRPQGMARKIKEDRGAGHAVVLMGPIAYCTRCVRFAKDRLGVGLKGPCTMPQVKTQNAAAARLRRLRAGRHPLTGEPLDLR